MNKKHLRRFFTVTAFAAGAFNLWRPAMFLADPASSIARADAKLSGDLAKAIRAGDLDAVKVAVDAGADINALDERKMPPIGVAALLGKTDIINYLAEKGADVNRNDGFGFTPLMCAAQRGQAGAVRALIKHGADPALKGSGGSTPLLCAMPKGPADPIFDEKSAVTKILKDAIAAGPVAVKPNPQVTNPPVVPPADPAPVKTTPADPTPAVTNNQKVVLPTESAIVNKSDKGVLGVAEKNGKPIDGLKLSQHDSDIFTPNISVASDGTIHVAFVEKHRTTYALAAYHRSSSDGGKTWTEAKNLSEVMPGWIVGNCRLLVDAKNRAYVIWRTGIKEGFLVPPDAYFGHPTNLVYRVLDGGKWSKVINLSPPGSETPTNGAMQWFAEVDAAGRAQACWNNDPAVTHKELLSGSNHDTHTVGIYPGIVFQSTLDGSTPTAAREVFMTKVAEDPKLPNSGPLCDGFGVMTGYFDAAGQSHFVANITSYIKKAEHPIFDLIENGKRTPAIETPGTGFETWHYPPPLLLDAKENRHVISIYAAGERPNVRDTQLGSDDEPTVIRAATAVKGTVDGFEAYQAPGGKMVVLMQMNDTGNDGDSDTYVSISEGGGKWSPAVDITNNSGRQSFMSRQTGVITNVALLKRCYPGMAAATFDKDGHMLVLMINNEFAVVASNVGGATVAGGSTRTPTLQFLKF